MKKDIAEKFMVFDYGTFEPIETYQNLNEALSACTDNENLEVIVLDRDGNNVSMEYWKQNY